MTEQNKTKKRVAEIISYVLDPIFLGMLIAVTSIIKSNMSQNLMIGWIVCAFVLNLVIPGLLYLYFTSHGFVFDATLTNKRAQKERIIMFIVFLAAISVEILILISTTIYQPVFAVLIGGVIAITFSSIISYFWKISIHALMTTFFVAMVIMLFGWQCWPILICVPLIMWSRLVLKKHNLAQVIGGTLMALLIITVTFSLFGLL